MHTVRRLWRVWAASEARTCGKKLSVPWLQNASHGGCCTARVPTRQALSNGLVPLVDDTSTNSLVACMRWLPVEWSSPSCKVSPTYMISGGTAPHTRAPCAATHCIAQTVHHTAHHLTSPHRNTAHHRRSPINHQPTARGEAPTNHRIKTGSQPTQIHEDIPVHVRQGRHDVGVARERSLVIGDQRPSSIVVFWDGRPGGWQPQNRTPETRTTAQHRMLHNISSDDRPHSSALLHKKTLP